MQGAETVLGVIRERGRQGLPLERLYRQLFNKEGYRQPFPAGLLNGWSVTQ